MTMPRIILDAGPDGIARWIADRLEAALAKTSGPVHLCVPGGSTPFPVMQRLAALPLDWPRVTVWPGDDRIVPEDHPASNVGRIRSVFGPAGARVMALTQGMELPHFALVWLGMGGDGHFASLFPSSDPRVDDPATVRHLTPDPLPPEAPFDRLSLTIPALLDSDALLFLISGPDKRTLFEAAARGENDLPVARLLAAARQSVTCFA
jgi:6-phosphogluconolactonase